MYGRFRKMDKQTISLLNEEDHNESKLWAH